MIMGVNMSPATWKLYINAILHCLWSRKYYEAIMDGLLLFTPNKEVSEVQAGRCIKYIVEEWIENCTEEVPIV